MSSFTLEEDHFMDAGEQSVSQLVLQVEQDKQVLQVVHRLQVRKVQVLGLCNTGDEVQE